MTSKTARGSVTRIFTHHPHEVGETYSQHMRMAFGFGACLLLSGAACVAHGIFPFVFKRTASSAIERLHAQLVLNRTYHARAPQNATRN